MTLAGIYIPFHTAYKRNLLRSLARGSYGEHAIETLWNLNSPIKRFSCTGCSESSRGAHSYDVAHILMLYRTSQHSRTFNGWTQLEGLKFRSKYFCYFWFINMAYRPKVYITRQIPQRGLECLLKRCNVSYWESPDPAPRTEILFNVRGVDILLCMPTDIIDVDVLNRAGNYLYLILYRFYFYLFILQYHHDTPYMRTSVHKIDFFFFCPRSRTWIPRDFALKPDRLRCGNVDWWSCTKILRVCRAFLQLV